MTDINEDAARLEEIIRRTGENDHLADLLLIRASKKKGASADEILNDVVQPTLEDLEFYLRYYTVADMSDSDLKNLVCGWIDAQIKKYNIQDSD